MINDQKYGGPEYNCDNCGKGLDYNGYTGNLRLLKKDGKEFCDSDCYEQWLRCELLKKQIFHTNIKRINEL